MQLPLDQLYPQDDDASAALVISPKRAASSIVPRGTKNIAYLYTSGSDIVGYNTRASVTDYLMRRAITSVGSMDDLTLADAFPASATALACTNYTANKVANLPLRILNARREVVAVSPLDAFIHDAPLVLRQIAFSLRIWGRFYLRKRYNTGNYPTVLEWINPSLVYEVPGRDGYVASYQITDPVSGMIEDVSPRDVIYAQDFDSRADGTGLSRYEAAWRHINVQLGIITYSAAFFVNNARPDGIISFKVDPSDEMLDKIQENFARQLKGVENSHRTTILPGDATYTPIASDPNQTGQTETDERTVKHICAIFGVHPALIGMDAAKDPLGATTTFNSMEVAFMRDVAKPLVTQIVLPALNPQWAARDFLDPYTIEVDDARVPEFAESQLARTDTANALVSGNLTTFDEARALLGMEPDTDYPLKRDPAQLLSLWQGGAATLDLFLQGIGILEPGKTLGRQNGNVVMVAGQPVPLDRLREYADAIVDKVKAEAALMASSALSPFGDTTISQEPPPTPALPETVTPEPEARADDLPDTSLCIALDLSNHPDLIAMQRAVKDYCTKQGIAADWKAPDSFHVTLSYAASATDEQVARVSAMLAMLPIPALSLHVGSLSAFESVGAYPLHLRVRRNDDLLALQRACYDAMRACGLVLSEYSAPDAYKPHITVGYADAKVGWTYKGDLRVKPAQLVVWYGDGETVYEKACGADEAARVEPVTVRAKVDTRLALRFGLDDAAPNVHLAQACRTLDEAFRAAGVPNPEWTPRDAYRLDLCDLTNAPSAAVSRFMRGLSLDDVRVLDMWTAGYALRGRTVYLTLEDSGDLDALRTGLALEADGVGIEADELATPGIALCELSEDIDPAVLPDRCARLPLVGVALSLYRNQDARHTWALAGRSEAQVQELKAYARRMARNAEKPFVFEALKDHPAALWLDDARAADVALDDAMEVARAILAGEWRMSETRSADYLKTLNIAGWFTRLSSEDVAEGALSRAEVSVVVRNMVLRAYRETRVGFIDAVYKVIVQARGDEGSRRKFGGAMRALVRQTGLQVIYDAYEQAGTPIESFSQDDIALFRAWQAETSEYISNFGAELFKDGITDNEVEIRANMWANKTLDDLYYTFLRQAAPAQKVTWKRNKLKDSCGDCVSRDGQSLTIDEWGQIGFPRDRRLECGGWECGCELIDEKGAVLRAFPNEPAEYLTLPHNHEGHRETSDLDSDIQPIEIRTEGADTQVSLLQLSNDTTDTEKSGLSVD